jgi:hypothetical protein
VSGPHLVDETAWSLGWISPAPGYMRRASHAVLAGGGLWLIDPVDEPGAVDRALALGPPAGVVQLLDRHGRDCAAIAARLGVPLHPVPDAAPPGAPFEVIPVVRSRVPRWRECALWFPEHRALVVADALGTAGYFRAPGEPVGPHPLLRIARPPRTLSGRGPEHVLCGHGPGVHGPGAAAAVDDAIRHSRRRIPRWLLHLPRGRGGSP